MPGTYFPISSTTLSSTSSNIAFTSIPQTYTDLRMIISAPANTSSNSYLVGTFNSDVTSSYSNTDVRGSYGSVTSQRTTTTAEGNYLAPSYGTTPTDPGVLIWDIFSYTSSTIAKSSLVRQGVNNGDEGVIIISNLWRNTAAITQINVVVIGSPFAVGSVISLYGIKAA